MLEGREIDVRVATGGEVAERICEGLDAQDLPRVSLGGDGRWILLEPAPPARSATAWPTPWRASRGAAVAA